MNYIDAVKQFFPTAECSAYCYEESPQAGINGKLVEHLDSEAKRVGLSVITGPKETFIGENNNPIGHLIRDEQGRIASVEMGQGFADKFAVRTDKTHSL